MNLYEKPFPKNSNPGDILILSGVRGDTRRYRALHLVEQMRLCGLQAMFVHLTDPNFERALNSRPWEMAIFHRVPYRKYLNGVIERLRKNNTLILSDFDDLIFDTTAFQFINSPDFADSVRSSMYIETMQRIREMLDCTDGVFASTDFLAGRIRQLNKPVWVHRNAFSFEMQSICRDVLSQAAIREARGKIVIGYASGTPTHNRDFEMIRPALMRILHRYPQAELHLIGPLEVGDGWGDAASRISRSKLVPWRKLPWLLRTFDINLAPLVLDNPFAQSKSEIKYMEAAMVGVPTIASPTDAFLYAIRPGLNGFLAGTQDEWVDALSSLIEDPAKREKTGNVALETVLTEYHPATRAGELANSLEEISQALQGEPFWKNERPTPETIHLQAQRASAEGGWVPRRYEKGPSYFQMGLFSLRSTGFKATLLFVWVFFRRMISPIIPYKNSAKNE